MGAYDMEEAKEYKELLVSGIIEFTKGQYKREELERKNIKTLERIYDKVS